MIIKPKKSLGQNFLIDKNIIKKIVDLGNLNSKDYILEVGPGTGNLTNEILSRKPKKIYVVEKDKNLSFDLHKKYKNKIEIDNSDILSFDEGKFSPKKIIIFGNLPYNISTQILVKWIISNRSFNSYKRLILMFQKDVADRIIATVNHKDFSRLTVISNWRLNIKKNFDVSSESFYPKPNVESSILTFEPKKKYTNFINPKNLEHVTHIFFSKRRKMINKAYKVLFGNDVSIADELKIDLKKRPSNLSLNNYYDLTKKYENLRN